jgi:hypothetical protein
MFADSFYDSAWANPSHRGWTTLASLVAQLLALRVPGTANRWKWRLW